MPFRQIIRCYQRAHFFNNAMRGDRSIIFIFPRDDNDRIVVFACCSLQPVQQRRVFDAGRREPGLVRYAALLQQHLPDAIRDTVVPREGKHTPCVFLARRKVASPNSFSSLFFFSLFHRARGRACASRGVAPINYRMRIELNRYAIKYSHDLRHELFTESTF